MSDANSKDPDFDKATPADPKLIPEWRVAADDQIVLVGFVVLIIVVLGLGWQLLRGGADDAPSSTTVTAATD